MGLKYSVDFTVAFSKSLFFYSHKKYHSLSEISEKVHITAKFQKAATSGVSASSITSIYLI